MESGPRAPSRCDTRGMRADLAEKLQRVRAIREDAAAEREAAIKMRETATAVLKKSMAIREQISRQLAEARVSSATSETPS